MATLTSAAIVTATVAALTGRTAAAARVYPWRTLSVQGDLVPCLLVAASNTTETRSTHQAAIYRVTTTVGVEVHTRAADDATWSAQLDTLCDRIKRAMLFDVAWRAQFRAVSGVTTQIGASIDGEYRTGVALVEFACEHDVTYEPLEDLIFDDLDTVHYTDETRMPIEAEFDTGAP